MPCKGHAIIHLYKDVIVRVAGYSAYFVGLTPKIQNEVRDRTTNEYF